MKKFNLKSDYSHYYNADILDIWYQDNKIVSYVYGTYIYKTEMIITNDKIVNFYCSCPSSEGGMNFCKHLSGVVNYLKENEVPEMESVLKEEKLDFNLSLNEILIRFKRDIYDLVDDYIGRINCYNSSRYSEIIIIYTKYIDNLLEKNNTDLVFDLVIQLLNVARNVKVDSEEEYDGGINELIHYIDKLINEYNYKNNIINYIKDNYIDNEITLVGIDLVYSLIYSIESNEDAKNIIELIHNIKKDDYHCDNLVIEMLDIASEYISLDYALKLANEYRNTYGVKIRIIEYLEKSNNKNKLIRELKKQIKESSSSILYEKLLNIYLSDDIEEAKKLLLDMVNKFYSIEYYKKLKSICNKSKMIEYRKEIINNLNKGYFNNRFLLEIYEEDNQIKELFNQIKKYNDLSVLSNYKDKINSEYHEQLINYYKKLIINRSKNCYGRNEYYALCRYINDLYQLDCSSDFIIDMLKDMYPYYKTKKAFKEEILKVLNSIDKQKFDIVVCELDICNKK